MNIWQVHLSSLPRGGSCVGHLFLLFIHNYLSENSYCHTNLILLIAWNLCILISVFSVWLIKIKCTPHPSHHWDCFSVQYVILKGWKGRHWSTELLGGSWLEGGSDFMSFLFTEDRKLYITNSLGIKFIT